ncbi:MAG: recombination regulator RecX [Candidatus Eisenbacteria bacterium]|uniref:Regulatory protein RecX n=1 Tax=Eiseniibacteriota bacterium TaxID=2212470 RepID=A0A948RVC6_UNCEI|nr:recombination regulator RecX [Candidatus Eisenbacteria bacterium]MBU1950649.1 recombination regulator RecX [Candidatus Eisenbacteria bacterium]MBU2689652.1 recombination regulator RecX [Candidatus Eisenbacteria bacterium]
MKPPVPARDAALERDALRLLKVRERCRKELERRLKQKGHANERIEDLLNIYEARGWINDERFATFFVRDRIRLRPKSYRMIDRELSARGVALEIRQRVLSEFQAEFPEEEMARSQALRRWRSLSGDLKSRRVSLIRWLRTKGYPLSLARRLAGEMAEVETPADGGFD